MRGLWVAAAFVLVLGVATPALPSDAHVDKKKCRWVVKKIHGKKKRVRVCTKVKPKPPKKVHVPTAPKPVSVLPQVDESRSVRTTIGSAGGTVSASGANGSSYTLSVPAGALAESTQITLTPVTSIGKLPLSGGLVAAARLQPEGLTFAKPGTLTISLGKSVAVTNQIAFASTDSGKDFHLYPKQSQARIVTLTLAHFTVEGVGQGTTGDVVRAAQHPPSSWQAQAEQLRALLQKARELGKNSPFDSAELEQKTRAALKEAYEQHVLPDLQAATTSSNIGAIEAAIREALSWMRTAELLGVDYEAEKAKLFGLIEQALRNLLARVQERCGLAGRHLEYLRDAHSGVGLGWTIDAGIFKKIISIVRGANLLGFEGPPFDDALDAAVRPCRPRGFKFELDVHASQVTREGAGPFPVLYTYSGRVCASWPDEKPWTLTRRMVLAAHVWQDEVSAEFLGGGPLTDGEMNVDDLLLGDDIAFTFTIGRETVQMRATVSPVSVDIGGDIRTFDPAEAAVPLLEDLSCPAVGS